mmetsp:Transcript_24107/g.37562  ORF Transcript_24107/g.37562 Transcript_24107/m.37562 type:complete len:223 (-) Transcript_24107:8-676(-)
MLRVILTNVFLSSVLASAIELDENERALVCLKKTVTDWPHELDVCLWSCVICRDGIVWKIAASYGEAEVVSFNWLPPTLRKVRFYGKKGRKRLYTRHLPRSLLYFQATACDIFGKIDFRQFPENTVIVNLEHNKIGGTLYIGSLPDAMKWIFLEGNLFKRVYVFYDDLPSELRRIQTGRVCDIRAAEAYGEESPNKDKVQVSFSSRSREFEKQFKGWDLTKL